MARAYRLSALTTFGLGSQACSGLEVAVARRLVVLREHCAAIMARHKIPRYLWIVDEPLPRNASGKFLRRQLRETLALPEAV